MAEATSMQVCIDRHIDYPFDVWETEMSDIQRARLETMYALARGTMALDVGCNSGYAALMRPDMSWSGVDVSPDLVAKAKARMAAQVATAEALPHDDGSFDTVVLGEILEHVYDPRAVMAEAARVARLAVVGSTPHESSAWGKQTVEKHRFHVRAFSAIELCDLLSEFGQVNITLSGHFQFFEVAL